MKGGSFIAQVLIGAVIYAAIVWLIHVIAGVPANWTLDFGGLAAYVLAVFGSRAIMRL